MTIGGISIILILGIVNFALIAFQLLGGLRVIRASFKAHKYAGIILCITATLHGVLALLVS
jgi:hypothetical protein